MEVDKQCGGNSGRHFEAEVKQDEWGSIASAESSASGSIHNNHMGEEITLRDMVLHRAANSDGHFKHQQRGEPDLTPQEKLEIVTDLLDNKPTVFLTRFGKYLHAKDLEYFNHMKGDYTIDFHIKEIRQHLDDRKCQTKIRNRRYEAMKQLTDEGEYFCDDEMKQRDPFLYEQMVGQYLTDDEIHAQVDKSDLSFSNILLKHIQVLQSNELYAEQKDIEESQMEEEEEEEDSEEESELESEDEGRPKISESERQQLRQEFLHTMQQRFLSGRDTNFDYSQVDSNVEYDSVEQWGRDAEEKYFDDEESQSASPEPDLERLSLTANQDCCPERSENPGPSSRGECMDKDLAVAATGNSDTSNEESKEMDSSDVG